LVSLFVGRLPFDLSSKGDPVSSYATAGVALRVPGILKPPHHDEVETPTRRASEKTRKMTVKIFALSADIRTGNFLNKTQVLSLMYIFYKETS
jgi:hypothetical protein